MMINSTDQKSRRNKQVISRWFIWHESAADSWQSDTDLHLSLDLIDEADLSDYIDSMNKSNIELVSLQKIRDIPASF